MRYVLTICGVYSGDESLILAAPFLHLRSIALWFFNVFLLLFEQIKHLWIFRKMSPVSVVSITLQ
jgi:hypothetical protein